MPNTKVVANIQIYLHAKFQIFLTHPSISPILSPPADLFNWKRDLDWKIVRGHFLHGRPISVMTQPISVHEPACQLLPHHHR
jgi:hypothetical protein